MQCLAVSPYSKRPRGRGGVCTNGGFPPGARLNGRSRAEWERVVVCLSMSAGPGSSNPHDPAKGQSGRRSMDGLARA